MNYAHDLVVNYKSNFYQFYEWQKNDEVMNIKSIVCIKVSDNTLKDFINNKVKVSNAFLDMIENKTISDKSLKYACILFNDEIAVSFLFDDKGYLIKMSSLIYDESDDIVNKYYHIDKVGIKYKIINENKYDLTKTRYENKVINSILYCLKNSSSNKEKIKYLYYECFNNYEKDYTKAYKKLTNEILNNNTKVIYKLNKILSLIKK